ncbi:MAG TPA: hypothetical protein VEK15_27045 [Vicinamibacteria bacterium]|nr:hypothetical protein [Vicinamibacteria bacterium]
MDRSLLRENLKLTVEERLRKLASMLHFLEGWRGAASNQRIRRGWPQPWTKKGRLTPF